MRWATRSADNSPSNATWPLLLFRCGGITLFLVFTASLSAAPQLVLNTTSLDRGFNIFPGSNGASQIVQAYNVGTGSLNLSTMASAAWLAASVEAPQICTAPATVCYPIVISLNTAALPAGQYTGYVTVADPNAVDSPQQIAVTVNIAGIPSSLNFYLTPVPAGTNYLSYDFAEGLTHGTVTGAATTESGGDWLSFRSFSYPGENLYEYEIVVTAQSEQAPGSYTGSVVLAGDNPADNQTVSVTLNVTTSPIIGGYNVTCTPSCPDGALNGSPGETKPTETVTFSVSVAEGTLTITGATASSTGNFLSASVSGANTIVLTADPGTLSPGYYSGTVTIASNAVNNSQVSVPVVFIVDPAGKPLVSEGGIVDIGEYAPIAIAPGEILAVFGDQFAAPGTSAVNPGPPPLATTLGGTQVLVNGTPAPLYFSSPEQVNFQLPYETPVGQLATFQVVWNGTPGNMRSLNVNAASAPVLLVWPASVIAGGYGIVVNQDNSLVLPTAIPGFSAHPAKVGDTITIYCTGLGETTPAAVTGAAASSTQLETVTNPIVEFGYLFNGGPGPNEFTSTRAVFAGLTPTAVGLYQVNATIPPGTIIGSAVPVYVNHSFGVYIAISQ